MFHKVCGPDSLQKVVIVTTMWDKVTPEEGSRREDELRSKNNLFKPWLDGKAIMMRHERTTETANKIISYLLAKGTTSTRIAHELVKEKKKLQQAVNSTAKSRSSWRNSKEKWSHLKPV